MAEPTVSSARRTFGPVVLLGLSWGGRLAACVASRRPELIDRLESALAQGRPEQLLETFYRHVALISEEEIAQLKAAPTWPARLAAAHTVPRELRAFGGQAFDPAWAAKISVPVLLLVGADSPDEIKADPETVAAALPDARIHVLEGQAHLAHLTDPRSFADAVLSFLRD